jgi:hypothetical protein
MKFITCIAGCLILHFCAFAQADTGQRRAYQMIDTVYNPHHNGAWGNSTLISLAVNFARNKEYEFGIGRSYGLEEHGDRGLGVTQVRSWGLAYSVTPAGGKKFHSAKAFYEYNFFPYIILFNFGLRGEYLYNFTSNQHYLRPSLGMTFVRLDLLYNYSFLLNNKDAGNLYRHGIALRLKHFHSRKNWERRVTMRVPG